MSNIKIRQATIEDLVSIQNLNNELFKLEKEYYDSTLIANWPISEEGKIYFSEMISNEYAIVAVIDNNIIGYLIGSIIPKCSYETIQYGEINNMIIDYKYRGLGIGKELINQFKSYCLNKEIYNLKVEASSKNIDAIEFYKKQGFNDFNVTLTMNLNNSKN